MVRNGKAGLSIGDSPYYCRTGFQPIGKSIMHARTIVMKY